MRASIACPRTSEVVTIEVMTDAQTVAASWKKFIRFNCPRCEDRHAIPFKKVYIDGVLTNLCPGGTGMFQMPGAPPG
jgi:phage FluMu protein Com